MKTSAVLCTLLGAASLFLSSCATQDLIAKAQGRPGPLDPPNAPPTKPNPAYYLLVPAVAPFDLVFWPFEYAYLNNRPYYAPVSPSAGPQPAPYAPAPAPYRPNPYLAPGS